MGIRIRDKGPVSVNIAIFWGYWYLYLSTIINPIPSSIVQSCDLWSIIAKLI